MRAVLLLFVPLVATTAYVRGFPPPDDYRYEVSSIASDEAKDQISSSNLESSRDDHEDRIRELETEVQRLQVSRPYGGY